MIDKWLDDIKLPDPEPDDLEKIRKTITHIPQDVLLQALIDLDLAEGEKTPEEEEEI